MKPWIKKPNIVEEQFCRCPPSHPVQDHDENGCTRDIVVFNCKNKGHEHFDTEDCWTTISCRCRIPNKAKPIGQSIQEAEKTTA